MAEILQAIVAARGDNPALIDESGETTWAELDVRTNRIVHALRAAGLSAGDRVALLMGNRRETFEFVMAGYHGGFTLVPLNWHLAPDEIAYTIDDSDARAFVVDERFAEVARAALALLPGTPAGAPGLTSRLFVRAAGATGVRSEPVPEGFVDFEAALAAASPGEPEDQRAGTVMFYTSGTTGRPKGVTAAAKAEPGPSSAVTAGGQMFCTMLGIAPDGVTLLDGPYYHSAQFAWSALPLAAGSTIVMRHRFVPEDTLDLIDRHGVTNVHLVPTQLLRLLKVDEMRRAAFSGKTLTAVWHGAAPCPPEVKRRILDWWGPVLHEYYGATEGGIITTIKGDEWLERPGSVGKPWPAAEIFVRDDAGKDLPAGVTGQLWFRDRLGRDFAYHKDPDKTAKAHQEPGVYTFGDIGRVDEDGYLFLSDRKIDMIISGGVNIYPAEIEGVLVTHPAVADAAVFGIPDDEFGEQVKAAVELMPGAGDDTGAADGVVAELVALCRDKLAGFKVPKSFDIVETLPRTPTGKLQKRRLRDPYWEGTGRSM